MSALLDVNENRRDQRWRSFLAGKIIFNDRASVYDCSVRNISTSGAKLWVFNPAFIPDHFDLEIEAKGVLRSARVVWRSAKEIGITFTN